jgi:hypothetical protein
LLSSSVIRERTGAGRKRAMANGVKFGRKPKLSPYLSVVCYGAPRPQRSQALDDFGARMN